MNASQLMKAFFEEGYCIVDILTTTQMDTIEARIRSRILEAVPKAIQDSLPGDWNLESYHELIGHDQTVHKDVANIGHRFITLPDDVVDALKTPPVSEIMQHYWGHEDTLITHRRGDPDEPLSADNACGFRVARPGLNDAVGVHVDRYYGSVSELTKVSAISPNVLTAWIPVIGFDERYSLRMAPRSHLIDHPSDAFSQKDGYVTHTCNEDYENQFEYVRPTLKRGQAIVFHPNLLHGRSLNLGDRTRISLEPRLRDQRAFSLVEKKAAS